MSYTTAPDSAVLDDVAGKATVITEIRRKEALLKAGALQNAIFSSANFSIIATDEKGVIQLFNVGAERMLGYTAAGVLNKITPADISDPHEVIARAKALSLELATTITPGFEALVFKASRGIEDIYELTYIRKDGSRFPAIVSVTALSDDQGAIIGYLLIGTDNTARKEVEAEQKKLDQRLRDQQFYTRSLIESNIRDYDHRSVRHHHRRQQADGGADRLHARRADRRAVQELLHRSGAGRSGHQTGAERKEGHLKFTPEQGHIKVSAFPAGSDHFRIQVEDSGIGIKPEDVPRLFVEFQQLDEGASKKYQGTGLGLALTKRIVEAQGGRVGVTSAPGKGSTFFAILPRHRTEP